jgi:hypothetical protein
MPMAMRVARERRLDRARASVVRESDVIRFDQTGTLVDLVALTSGAKP